MKKQTVFAVALILLLAQAALCGCGKKGVELERKKYDTTTAPPATIVPTDAAGTAELTSDPTVTPDASQSPESTGLPLITTEPSITPKSANE